MIFASAARTSEGSKPLFGFYCSSVRSYSLDFTETSITTGVLRNVEGWDDEGKQTMDVSFFLRSGLCLRFVEWLDGHIESERTELENHPYMLIFYMNFGPDRYFPCDV